jgi:hypothetical protein
MKSKYLRTLVLTVFILLGNSCEILDLDINENPNAISTGDPDLLMASVINNGLSVFAGGLNNTAHGFMGITTATDNFDMTNASWNGTWNFLYAGPLKDLEELIKVAGRDTSPADGNPDLPHHLGIAQTLKAYYYSLMVDLWGDIPYSQAFQGDAGQPITAPVYDNDETIYADLLVLTDAAIANFARTTPAPVKGDIIYGSTNNTTIADWRRTAKSLKLRLLINTRRVQNNQAAIQALITENDFVDAPSARDFTFQFGKFGNPDFSHPWYSAAYSAGQNGFSYFGHQFMFEMLRDNDPRRPFYLKRQTSTVLDPSDATARQTIPCSQRDDCVYNYFPLSNLVANEIFGTNAGGLSDEEAQFLAGFFGRDRSDPSGVPNDGNLRTAPGVYPAGGLYDDVPEATANNNGFGTGIFPMITSWMVKLYKAEAALAIPGITGINAEDEFLDALAEQIEYVETFGTGLDSEAEDMDDTDVDDYIADWSSRYTTSSNKLSVVLKQSWFMNFGNGFEIYNAFRRTRLPNDLQSPLQRPRQFALRLPYAQDELNLNSANTPVVFYDNPNAAVFWDVEKFQF